MHICHAFLVQTVNPNPSANREPQIIIIGTTRDFISEMEDGPLRRKLPSAGRGLVPPMKRESAEGKLGFAKKTIKIPVPHWNEKFVVADGIGRKFDETQGFHPSFHYLNSTAIRLNSCIYMEHRNSRNGSSSRKVPFRS